MPCISLIARYVAGWVRQVLSVLDIKGERPGFLGCVGVVTIQHRDSAVMVKKDEFTANSSFFMKLAARYKFNAIHSFWYGGSYVRLDF